MHMKKTKQIDMTVGDPLRLMTLFAIPLFLGNVFQMFYNMADSAVVGRFIGAEALAAVGAASPGFNLFTMVISGFTSGASVVIAQAFGSGDEDNIKKAYSTSVLLLFYSGLLFTIIGFAASRPVLRLLGTPENVFPDALTYMRWMCIGLLATCLYNGMGSILRAAGDSMTPLIALIISSILNIILDVVFVLFFHLGVAGVAIATVIAQLISGIYCVASIRRNLPVFRVRREDYRIYPPVLKETIRLGLPAALSSAVVNFSVMLIQRAVNGYGSDIMAAYTVSGRAEHVGFCLSYSIGMAVGIFVAQNAGAGRFDRVRQGLFSGIRLSLVYHIFIALLMWFGAPYLVRVFTDKPAVIEVSTQIIHISAVFAPVLGLVFIFQNFLRNVSDVMPTIVMSGAEILCRGVLPFLLSSRFGYYGIWWATPIGWSLSLLIGIIRYRSGKWKNKVRTASV